MIKKKIQQLIKEVIRDLQRKGKLPDFEIPDIKVDRPEKNIHGDYAVNIALRLAKKIKKPPLEVARIITDCLERKDTGSFFERVEVVYPGFINFFVSFSFLINNLIKVLKEDYTESEKEKGKTLMVEYANPNTHKAFHIGHLRNIANGEAVIRILEAVGFRVIRANYQGDVGLHIAKCLWAAKQTRELKKKMEKLNTIDKKIGFLEDCYVAGSKAYKRDKKAREEISSINKQIYNRDPKIKDLWQETRQWSLDYFERVYKRVYSHFDRYYFEQEVAEPGKEIVLRALQEGIFRRSKGAVIFPGSKYGLHDRVFITKEGNATYEAKDLALAELQFKEYDPSVIIHNVGPEQLEYFKVIFEALTKIFPYTEGREYHLVSGWVRLKNEKMSSRKGNVIKGEWLLEEAKRMIKDSFPEITEGSAEKIAVGAVKYSFLKIHPAREVVFDFSESVSLEGNSGPYLQYTYTRAQSVLQKSRDILEEAKSAREIKEAKEKDLNREEIKLLKLFTQFPEVIEKAAEKYSPNLICNFLFEFTQEFNSFYERSPILKAKTPSLRRFRLSLTQAAANIISKGLYLLGIKTLKKM